ncbi:MAG: VOC family protein [Acidimicrobiales bacterium]
MSVSVPDSARFRAFFGEMLGWSFAPGHGEDGWEPTEPMPRTGVSGGHDTVSTVPMWQVDDIQAARQRALDLGGTATAVERQPYGLSCECTDGQGSRFYLHQP